MGKKFTFFFVSMLLSLGAMAQGWVKPAPPAKDGFRTGAKVYLYNIGTEGFFLGANDWYTRASWNPTRGYKVTLEEYTVGGVTFDGHSYLIWSDIEDGNPAGQTLCLFVKGVDDIWVDTAVDSGEDKGWTIDFNGDGTFKIGLSEQNKVYKESEGWELTYLGAPTNPETTKLYLIDYAADKTASVDWYLVAPEEYDRYVAARKQYDAAVELGKSIEAADAVAGVDATVLSNAKAAYADTTTATDVLIAQKTALDEAVQKAKEAAATVDNPVEMLAPRGFGTDFTDGEVRGWTSTLNAQNKQASNGNGAKDYSVTGNHYENWNGDAFAPGKVSVTPTNLPDGVYQFKALAFTNTGKDLYLYAGSVSTPVTAVQIDAEEEYDVVTFTGQGSLEVGLEVRKKGPNWIGLDNAGLYYLGVGDDALALLKSRTTADEPDFGDYYQKTVGDTYFAAKSAYMSATSLDAVKATYPAYQAALKDMQVSSDAYKEYYAKFVEVMEFVDEFGDSFSGDEMELLILYMTDDESAPGNTFPNGSGMYILTYGNLTADQVVKEIDYMVQLKDDALAHSMKDGDEVTSLLKNPHFAEEDGWTRVGQAQWPKGPDTYKLGEAYSVLFNVYQELTGLQEGLYELTLSDFYRPADYGAAEYDIFRAYVYLNDDEVKMNTIESGATDDPGYSSDVVLTDGKFVPNDVDGAAAAFQTGRYQQKVYGIVTDGNLKLGVRTDVRYENNWGVWSDFKLVFRAKNVDVCHDVMTSNLANAQALLEKRCGNPELNALQTAVSEGESATDDIIYNKLVALKNAMNDVKAGIEFYNKLEEVLKNLNEAIDANPSASKLAEAVALYEEVSAAFANGEYDNATAQAKIDEVSAMTVELKLGDMGDEETDVTNLIINPNFDPEKGDKGEGWIEGWTTTAMNGYKQYSVSYNKAPFHLYQDLKGLPKGKYRVTVHTYYRAGYYDEELDRINNGVETHLTKLYAETSKGKVDTPVKNLYDDRDESNFDVNCYTYPDGTRAPDGTTPTVAWFAKGKYLNELEFTVPEDGTVRIGLLKEEFYPNDYEVVGAWTLTFLGDNDRTSLIVNPNFDPEKGDKGEGWIEGWTTTAMNGYKQYSVSYNKAPFHLYQDLKGLPKGKYLVKVHTYYRAGYYDEELDRINNGIETHLTKLYAETSKGKVDTPVKNLYDERDAETFEVNCYTYPDGTHAPDGTTPTVAWFAKGKYLNELEFTVPEDGNVRIGLLKEEFYPNDYEVVGAWELYFLGDNDRTSLIVNPNFDPEKGNKGEGWIEGWTTTAMNGYKQWSVSYNKAPFHLYQDIAGLRPGKYEVTVHTYYRAGYYDEELDRINNGIETHLTKLYAETSAGKVDTPVKNLYDERDAETFDVNCYTYPDGTHAPDGTTPTVAWFALGKYLNNLQFVVPEDGKVRIGLIKEEFYPNDYEVVGAWNLYYLGRATAIENIEVVPGVENNNAPATVVGIYTLSGARIVAPVPGINILRMSDGTARKILVK